MTFDNMTGITEGSYTGFCKSQLITCNRVKECNGVCPFEDALKHADKRQAMNEQPTVDHDREWIIGCIEHDGFIKTDRFDEANQIILDALESRPHGEWIPCSERLPKEKQEVYVTVYFIEGDTGRAYGYMDGFGKWHLYSAVEGTLNSGYEVIAWKTLPAPYTKGESDDRQRFR